MVEFFEMAELVHNEIVRKTLWKINNLVAEIEILLR